MGFAARESLAQHLLPSWLIMVKSNERDEFLEKAVQYWLLVFPEDILPEQEEGFYNKSGCLNVFQLPVSEDKFLDECYERCMLKKLPDTPDRCNKRDDII